MMPTAEQVLSELPLAITLWTALTLCWGLYILTAYNKMMKRSSEYNIVRTKIDQYHSIFLMGGNAVLVAFLMLQPIITAYSDAVIITNIFFGSYLTAASISLARWWRNTANRQTQHVLS